MTQSSTSQTEVNSGSTTAVASQPSSDVLIEASDLGKCYRIYDDPKHRLKQALRRSKQYYREFWALQDVSFQVRRGETLGVIGRNGSGKSTLLQLLCGTLTPTRGEIRCHGRIAALLELGSGFNPEFSGIENVYLNASLHGLSQAQTDARLDDILSFADIGDFIYQPVKTYSSGMAVRLAFAVIANVDAEILVVDEALSVGDAFFNQKCFRYMNRQREENCLLFVSHDTTAIRSLCSKAILLSKGTMQYQGDANEVSNLYLAELYAETDERTVVGAEAEDKQDRPNLFETTSANDEAGWRDYRQDYLKQHGQAPLLEITPFDQALLTSGSFGTGEAEITAVILREGRSGRPLLNAMGGERVELEIQAMAHADIQMPIIGFILKDERGLAILGDNTCVTHHDPNLLINSGSAYGARFVFTLPVLVAGDYSICVAVAAGTQGDHRQLQWLHDAVLLRSECRSVYAGIAGIPMQRVELFTPEGPLPSSLQAQHQSPGA
jgi:lipopolysaccharide transport system ATP-binding protein